MMDSATKTVTPEILVATKITGLAVFDEKDDKKVMNVAKTIEWLRAEYPREIEITNALVRVLSARHAMELRDIKIYVGADNDKTFFAVVKLAHRRFTTTYDIMKVTQNPDGVSGCTYTIEVDPCFIPKVGHTYYEWRTREKMVLNDTITELKNMLIRNGEKPESIEIRGSYHRGSHNYGRWET